MKITLALFALLAVGFVAAKPKIDLSKVNLRDSVLIGGMLECIRNLLVTGDEGLGIPPMEPLEVVEEVSIDLSALGEDMAGHVSASNLRMDGFTLWTNEKVEGSIGLLPPSYTMDVELNFADLSLVADYDAILYSPVDGLDFFGTGNFNLRANNLGVAIYARISILTVSITDFSLYVSLGAVGDFEITGAYNDEERSAEISAEFRENGPALIAERAERINQLASDFILNVGTEGGVDDNDVMGDILWRCLLG